MFSQSPWHTLPIEMKLAVVDALDLTDVKAFSMTDQSTYNACVPTLFKVVKLNSHLAVERFLENVPRNYLRHVQDLDLCSKLEDEDNHNMCSRAQAEAVISILLACPQLRRLALRMVGSMDKSILSCFAHFQNLKDLTIANCGEEDKMPLSERLVVSIAASVPGLEHLSLDRVSRSLVHAPELLGVYPFVPLVHGDDDIPEHPLLGSELSLPSLLRIPTLRKLIIRDTHLGDAAWATTPVACRLEVLDLGSCFHENEDANRICIERIMTAVGRTVDEFSLTTAVSDAIFTESRVTPLQRLRKLHISPFFPIDSVVETMSTLAGSPIESLSLQCFEDDVIDMCEALQEFLSLRVERGPEFYEKLTRIDVSVAEPSSPDDGSADASDADERLEATRRLQELCRDLCLASQVRKAPLTVGNSTCPGGVGVAGPQQSRSCVAQTDRRPALTVDIVVPI